MLLSNTYEGGSAASTITAANSGGSSGSAYHSTGLANATMVYSTTTRSSLSSMSARHTAIAGTATAYYRWEVLPGGPYGTLYTRMYINQVVRSGAVRFQRFLLTSAAGTNGYVGIDTTGHIVLLDSAGTTQATSTMTLTLNTWYRIEVKIVASPTVGQIVALIYSTVEGLTAAEQVTSAASLNTNTAGSINGVYAGFPVAVADTNDLYIDDVAVDLVNPGPVNQLNILSRNKFINPQAVYRM